VKRAQFRGFINHRVSVAETLRVVEQGVEFVEQQGASQLVAGYG